MATGAASGLGCHAVGTQLTSTQLISPVPDDITVVYGPRFDSESMPGFIGPRRPLDLTPYQPIQTSKLHPAGINYPDVPRGYIKPTWNGAGLPNASGIYFLWADDAVEYVGQSIALNRRVTHGHGRVRQDHRISFVLIARAELQWAECWYIGCLRPRLNLAGRRQPWE